MFYNTALHLQHWLIDVNPGLLPLAAAMFSFVSSWHCALMCGPLVASSPKRSVSRLYLLRLLAYTAGGAALGHFGRVLRDSLEFKSVGAIAFVAFAAVSLFCVLPQIFPGLKWFSPIRMLSPWRGLVWGLMPCHLLFFYYGIAVLTASAWAGGGLLFAHAVMTMPALAYTDYALNRLRRLPKPVALVIKYATLGLVIVNLAYFWGVLTAGEEAARDKLFFCF